MKLRFHELVSHDFKLVKEFIRNAKTPICVSAYGILAVALICLRAFGAIDWSWWLILAPIYIPIVLCVLWVLLAVVIFLTDRSFEWTDSDEDWLCEFNSDSTNFVSKQK